MSGLLASRRKLSRRRKQWLHAVSDRHPDDRVFLAVLASVFVIAVGGAFSVLILGIWVANNIDAGGEPALAGTAHIFRPPPQPKPKLQAQPKPLAIQQHARYLHFQDPRFTAKFMANYLNGGPAFEDVVYGVATPSEITIHGTLHGSHFDLRLSKAGRQRVLLRNCMMGSCYSEWTGRFAGRELAQRSGRFHERSLLRQQVRAGVLRLWSRSGD